MIGFYDYTVILTYISFVSAVAGIFCASSRQLQWAIFFLAFSGFCDMFDGKIARTKKNRTEDEADTAGVFQCDGGQAPEGRRGGA